MVHSKPLKCTITFIVHCSRYKKENQTEAAKNRAKKEITKHTHTHTKQGPVTLSTKLQSTALTLNYLAVQRLEKKLIQY